MLRIYDEFLEDETILQLHDRTYRLHVSALIYCARNLTDGIVTDRGVKVLQAILAYPLKRHIQELVDAGIWMASSPDGFEIRNYLEFNPTAATVKAERSSARDRMRKLREKKAGYAECSGERDGERSGAVPYQPLPDQVKALGLSIVKDIPA